jgi:ankyrin repeat protein
LDYFLEAGAEVNRLGGAMGTALCAAAYMGNIDALNELIERGAEVGLGNHIYPNPAFGAIKGGRGEALDILMTSGADVKSATGPCGSALQLAAAEAGGNLGIVRAVLRAGAAVNTPLAGKFGSALCAAAAMGDELTVRFLINRGADVLARGGVYSNALQAACTRPGTKIAELLLRKGARVNERGGRFGSPLQAASVAGCTQKALLLLRHGADINFQGGRYGTALQAACVSGELMLVKMLVERGARLDMKGGFYGTPLLAAAILDYEDIVKYLLEERDDWEPLERKSNLAPEDFEYAEEVIQTAKAELEDPSEEEDSEWEDETDDGEATDSEDDEAIESEDDFLRMNVEAIPGSIEPRLSKWTTVREMNLHGIRQQVVRVESMEIEKHDDGFRGSRARGGTLAKDGGTAMDAVVGNREAQAKTGSNVVTVTSVSESDNELWQDLTTLDADDIS